MTVNLIIIAALAAAPPPRTPTPAPTPTPRVTSLKHSSAEAAAPSHRSLAEVARRTKLRGGTGIVISNSNLSELAGGVELTQGRSSGDEGSEPATAAPRAAGGDDRRALWQDRYQQARGRLLFLEREAERLEGEVARLQTQFYSWDDPAYRDGVIKPAWDKAVADLAATRERLVRARALPDEVMAEASRQGALPGWFRGLPEPQPVEDDVSPEATPAATPTE